MREYSLCLHHSSLSENGKGLETRKGLLLLLLFLSAGEKKKRCGRPSGARANISSPHNGSIKTSLGFGLLSAGPAVPLDLQLRQLSASAAGVVIPRTKGCVFYDATLSGLVLKKESKRRTTDFRPQKRKQFLDGNMPSKFGFLWEIASVVLGDKNAMVLTYTKF